MEIRFSLHLFTWTETQYSFCTHCFLCSWSSLKITVLYMKVMFQWSTSTITRKWQSRVLWMKHFVFIWYVMIAFAAELSSSTWNFRSGEWGDHVTLQAAADKVIIITVISLFMLMSSLSSWSSQLLLYISLSCMPANYVLFPLNGLTLGREFVCKGGQG